LDLGEPQKSNERSMARTMIGDTKREGQRKAKGPTRTKKKGRELIPLVVGSYFT
jgi:hypothetical protein